MSLFHQTAFLGQELALFLPPPDWSARVRITYALETDVEAGLSDRENRRPRREAMRLTADARLVLGQADAEALQTALWTLGDRLVGVPLWPDRLTAATWATRVHEAEYVVNYDAAGYALHARDAVPAEPAHAWLAPLLVGRLAERPRLEALTDDTAALNLTVRESSPWGFRIAPAPTAAALGPDWPATLAPDWSIPPVDFTEDLIELTAVGAGRVEAADGQEGAVRRGQELRHTLADREAVRTLLGFWRARAGRVQSFVVPWALRPGADAEATPHQTRARFGSDTLELEWVTDAAAVCTLRLLQVPWEIAAPEGEEPEQAGTGWLYRFTLDVPGGPVVWRYTDYERDLPRIEGGAPQTYAAAPIKHDALTQTLDLSDEPVTITSWLFAGNPLLRVLQRLVTTPLRVEIFRADPAAPDAAAAVYAGEVAEVEQEGRKLTASTQVLGGLLEAKVPAFFYSPVCNHAFCGAGCTLDPAAWTFGATIVGQAGNVLTVLITANPPGAALTADWFARGWLKAGTAAGFEIRQIVRSEDLSGGHQRLTLKRPLTLAPAGAAVTLRPHCTGTRGECEGKFANYINFGAHPHIGPRNLSVPQREVNSGSGKK